MAQRGKKKKRGGILNYLIIILSGKFIFLPNKNSERNRCKDTSVGVSARAFLYMREVEDGSVEGE